MNFRGVLSLFPHRDFYRVIDDPWQTLRVDLADAANPYADSHLGRVYWRIRIAVAEILPQSVTKNAPRTSEK